jgi:hypothetical protein
VFGTSSFLCLCDDGIIRAEHDVKRVLTFRALMSVNCNIIAESEVDVGMGAHLPPKTAACSSAFGKDQSLQTLLLDSSRSNPPAAS